MYQQMNGKRYLRALVGSVSAVLLCSGAIPGAKADTTAFSSPLTTGNQAWSGSLGLRFDVTQNIFVTDLGVFDSNAAAGSTHLASTLYSQIFDRTTQTPVSGVLTFNTTTSYSLLGGDRFQALSSPLELFAGGKYEIVAWGFTGSQLNGNRNVGPLPPSTLDTGGGAISFTDDASDYGSAGAYPTNAFSTGTYPGHIAGTYRTGFLAGTLQFQSAAAVPEPGAFLSFGSLLLVGGGGLWFQRRRRRSAMKTANP